ncbi:MAG: tetratricopeptide repeat protein [Bacillota bacterium]
MKPKNYFCAAMCLLFGIPSAVILIYCGEKFWGIVFLVYSLLGIYFHTIEIMLKNRHPKQASDLNRIRSSEREKAGSMAYEKYMTFFCSLNMPRKVESVYELPDIPDGINIASSNDTIAYNVWIADKKLVLCRFIGYGINFDTKQANDPKYIDTMIDSGNLVTRIELCDVVHYKLEGSLEKEYKISGGGGGEISVAGALTGKMMFGNTGAIIGSRTPIEPVKSKLIKHDTRVVVLTYVEEDVEKEKYFRPAALNAFDNIMMEKNFEVIKEIKRKKIISTAIGDTVPTKVEDGKKYFDKGVEAYNRNDYVRAIVEYSHAIKLQPEYAEAYNNRGEAYYAKGQHDLAIADYSQAIKLKPYNYESLNNRGVVYRIKGQYDLSIIDHSQAIELRADYAKAYQNRGVSFYLSNKFVHAIADYSNALKYEPNCSYTYYLRGSTYFYIGEFDNSIADLTHTINLDPANADAYDNRGGAYVKINEFALAIQDFDKAIELKPNSANTFCNRGVAHGEKGEYLQSIDDLSNSIILEANNHRAYINRGKVYCTLGQYNEAIGDYTQAIKLKPDCALTYFHRSSALISIDQLKLSMEDLSQAIILKHDYFDAYMNRGKLFFINSQYDKAISDYDQAVELNSADSNAFFSRGSAYRHMGQHEQAISDFSRAIELKPDYCDAYINRGISYYYLADIEKAIADYSQALRQKPECAEAYFNRGIAFGENGQYDQSIEDLNLAIKLKPDYLDAHVYRGYAYYCQKKCDEALIDYDNAICLNDDYAITYYYRGFAYKKMGRLSEAITDWLVVRNLDDELFAKLSEEDKAACDEAIYHDSETEQSLGSKQDDHAPVHVRYNSKIVYDFLVENGGGVCDECLSELTGITPSQQINLICRKLTKRQIIYRSVKKNICSVCGSRKLLNSSEVIDNMKSDSSSISNGISSGSAVDVHMSKIFEYLEKNEQSSFCDECLASVIGIHQSAINPMCRTMAEEELINRSTTRGLCSGCQSKRILNTYYDEANDPGLVSDVADIDYSDSQKYYEITRIDETNCSPVAPSTTVAISTTPKDADKCHKIFLISCVLKKRKNVTKAKDMYISDYFKKMWEYAQLQKPDKIFILSAKYGLLSPEDEIAPYEVTLKKMTDREVAMWSQNVLEKLRTICDLERDSFTVLAGTTYHKYISRYLKNIEIPMDGLTFGRCLQWLKGKISEGGTCEQIHRGLSKLPRYRYPFDLAGIPFHQNGVYVLYQAGEFAHGGDRIVRIGSHSGQDNLIKRLTEHFVVENKDRSIFRKNIGRCLLNKVNSEYLSIWEIDNTASFSNQANSDKRNLEFENSLEKDISTILRQQFSFVIIPVPSNTCLEVEKKLIATVNECNVCKASASWIGKYSNKPKIASGKLWQEQHLFGQAFASYDEFLKLTNVG